MTKLMMCECSIDGNKVSRRKIWIGFPTVRQVCSCEMFGREELLGGTGMIVEIDKCNKVIVSKGYETTRLISYLITDMKLHSISM